MWFRRITAVWAWGTIALAGAGTAWAANVPGDGTTMSAIQAALTADDPTINFTADATLTMDANGTGVSKITVAATKTATIDFGSAGADFKIIFKAGNGSIEIGVDAALNVTGDDTGAGFDFDTNNSGKQLTVNGTISNNVDANRLIMGDNTLQATTTDLLSLNKVEIGSGSALAKIELNSIDITIATLVLTNNAQIDLKANTLTLTNAVSIPAGKTLSFLSSGTVDGAGIMLDKAGTKLDVQDDVTINTLTMTQSAEIRVASGKTLTANVSVPAGRVLTLSGPGTITGVTLDAAGATLSVTSAPIVTTLTLTTNNTVINTATGAIFYGTVPVAGMTVILTGSGTLQTVELKTAGSKLDVNGSVTITTTTMTENAEIDVEDGLTLTATVDIPATKTLTLSGAGTLKEAKQTKAATVLVITNDAMLETLTVGSENFTINVANGKTLNLTNTVMVGDNTLTLAGKGTVNKVELDDSGSIVTNAAGTEARIDTLTLTASAKVLLADGKKLSVSNPIEVGGYTLTLQGSGGGVQDMFGATVRLTKATSILVVNGSDTDNIKDYTVSVEYDDTILDFNISSAPTAITMKSGSGDLNLKVANGKTLTTTVEVNNNVLTLEEKGSIYEVNLNGKNAVLEIKENVTIDTVLHSAISTIKFATDGKTLTLTNTLDVSGSKLELMGSGGGGQETLAGTIKLTKAAAQLVFSGKDTDDLTGMTIQVEADGATVQTYINIAPSGITMTADKGDLNLDVAAGKSIATTVTVNNNTLTLKNTGNPGNIDMNADGGALVVNINVTVDSINIGADVTVNVAKLKTMTTDLSIADNILSLTGTGTISKVLGTTGRITANAASKIGTLTVSPGAGRTFTYAGTGDSTVSLFTALNETGESLTKTGTGTLQIEGGFSFAGGNAIKLIINQGKLIDAGEQALVFGDDGEKITVASGATFETASDMTGHSGPSSNLDAAAGSTVNFTKGGTLLLEAMGNDDFKMLGTVNIYDGCELQLTGAQRYQFGNVNVRTAGALINQTPDSTMWFAPNSMLLLEGTGSGTLDLDGQSSSTLIHLTTTTGSGTFTINRQSSENMSLAYVHLSNCIYTSLAGGTADVDLALVGVVDGGNNTNWFGQLTVSAGPNKTIILGDYTTLEGSAYGASGTYTYLWTPSDGLDNPTLRTPKAAPDQDTTYTLTVTDGADTALTATDTVTVTVVPPLQVSAGPNKSIVAGQKVRLEGSASGGTGYYTYQWVPEEGLDNPNIARPTASPNQSLTYTLSVTDTGVNKTINDAVTVTVVGGGGSSTGLCGSAGLPLLALTVLGLVGLKHSVRT